MHPGGQTPPLREEDTSTGYNAKKPPEQLSSEGFCKTAATYSPTVTQYHRRGEA